MKLESKHAVTLDFLVNWVENYTFLTNEEVSLLFCGDGSPDNRYVEYEGFLRTDLDIVVSDVQSDMETEDIDSLTLEEVLLQDTSCTKCGYLIYLFMKHYNLEDLVILD
jgi:hypothetical protein